VNAESVAHRLVRIVETEAEKLGPSDRELFLAFVMEELDRQREAVRITLASEEAVANGVSEAAHTAWWSSLTAEDLEIIRLASDPATDDTADDL
jgi:hypothetical protein